MRGRWSSSGAPATGREKTHTAYRTYHGTWLYVVCLLEDVVLNTREIQSDSKVRTIRPEALKPPSRYHQKAGTAGCHSSSWCGGFRNSVGGDDDIPHVNPTPTLTWDVMQHDTCRGHPLSRHGMRVRRGPSRRTGKVLDAARAGHPLPR